MKSFFYGLLFFLNGVIYAATHTVTNTNDAGAGSLRQAIIASNADVTTPRLINFNIPGGVPQIITPITLYPAISATVTIDGTSQQPGWVFGNNMPIVLNCAVLASSLISGACILIDSTSNCVIKGLAIKSYVGSVNGYAMRINSTTAASNNNQIMNCYFGCNADGSVTPPFTDNTRSIVLSGNTNFPVNNTIVGGPNQTDGNLLVNTSTNDIDLQFNVNNTLIQNNFFGTDITGMLPVGGNPYDIAIFGAVNAPVNGTSIINNVLSNNTLASAAAINLIENVNNTRIENNKIGTNRLGTAALVNAGSGINTLGTNALPVNNTIIINNIISGNVAGGILLNDQTNNSIIQGNIIGTNITGTTAIPNAFGIAIIADTQAAASPSQNNLIGGIGTGQGNLISGNTNQGILLQNDVLNTTIQQNVIGVSSTGAALPNGSGIELISSLNAPVNGTLIGGTIPDAANTIKFNQSNGVLVNGLPSANAILNSILENSIYLNIGSGILLINQGNDNQQPPTFVSAQICNSGTQLITTVTAPALPASSHFRIEIFENDVNRNPITEGQRFIGAIDSVPSGQTVTTILTLSPGMPTTGFMSATATNLNNIGNTPGDTSEFSSNFAVSPAPAIVVTITPASQTLLVGGTIQLTGQASGGSGIISSIFWTGPNSFSAATSTITISPAQIINGGIYTFTATDSNGCIGSASALVIVTEPVIPAGPDSDLVKSIRAKYC